MSSWACSTRATLGQRTPQLTEGAVGAGCLARLGMPLSDHKLACAGSSSQLHPETSEPNLPFQINIGEADVLDFLGAGLG